MTVIGIDIGTACGWAVRRGPGDMISGCWDLSLGRFDGSGMRVLRLRRLFNELLDSTSPDLVAYEEVRRHVGTDAAHVYGELAGVIKGECELRKTPYCGMPVGTIKKFATGNGAASKDQMISAANAKWEVRLANDNEADARWCAECAAKKEGWE